MVAVLAPPAHPDPRCQIPDPPPARMRDTRCEIRPHTRYNHRGTEERSPQPAGRKTADSADERRQKNSAHRSHRSPSRPRPRPSPRPGTMKPLVRGGRHKRYAPSPRRASRGSPAVTLRGPSASRDFPTIEGLETSCPARPHDALSSACHSRRPCDTRGSLYRTVRRTKAADASASHLILSGVGNLRLSA